jgi:hypothetical protein
MIALGFSSWGERQKIFYPEFSRARQGTGERRCLARFRPFGVAATTGKGSPGPIAPRIVRSTACAASAPRGIERAVRKK